MSELEIKNLSFSYARHKVLNDVSLKADGGEFISLLGKNGAGKTTLFKLLLSLIKKQEGTILIDGKNADLMTSRERAKYFSYIPQESRQNFAYTVLTSVLMGSSATLSPFRSPTRADEEKALLNLKRFDIDGLKNRNVCELSGGERQLVLSARALLQDARFLLFDEPTSNLDYGNQIKVLRNIKALTKEGYTAIVSTHNLEQSLNYSSRIILLDEGKICFDGDAESLSKSSILTNFYNVKLKLIKAEGVWVCLPLEDE